MVTPLSEEYSGLVYQRRPLEDDAQLTVEERYSTETILKIVKVLCLNLENEGAVEAMRQKLASLRGLNTLHEFKQIDSDGDGFLNIYEVRTNF
jgi:hypothetical protein